MVSRVVRIIEQLAQSVPSPTLADLARSTGLPKSSLHRILALLAANGAVTRNGVTYRLSDRLVELIPLSGTRSTPNLRRLLIPDLTDLQRRTGLIVRLAVPAMPDVVFLETIYGHQARAAALQLPDRAPAHRTAAGKLLLALRRDGYRDHQEHEPRAPYATRDRLLLDRELAGIRDCGIAVSRGEYVGGMTTIAAAVIGRNGQPAAALTISGPTRANLGEATRHLREAAHAASLTIRGAVDRPRETTAAARLLTS